MESLRNSSMKRNPNKNCILIKHFSKNVKTPSYISVSTKKLVPEQQQCAL